MAAEGMPFPWRWNGDTILLNLGVIWEMSDKRLWTTVDGPNLPFGLATDFAVAAAEAAIGARRNVPPATGGRSAPNSPFRHELTTAESQLTAPRLIPMIHSLAFVRIRCGNPTAGRGSALDQITEPEKWVVHKKAFCRAWPSSRRS